MPIERQEPARRTLRADWILTGAIATLCAAIVALAALLSATEREHQNSQSVVARVRDIRAEVFGTVVSISDASTAAYSMRSTRDPTFKGDFDRAIAAAQVHIANLRTMTAGDPQLSAKSGRVDALFRESMGLLNSVDGTSRAPSRTQYDAQTDPGGQGAKLARRALALRQAERQELIALHDELNRRIDIARGAEDRTRAQLNAITLMLALFALAASSLAIYALRRERAQWRDMTKTLADAHAHAAQSDLAKTRFLAAASHDMRQPLHALTLYLSALRRRVPSEEGQEILSKMERATQSIVGMFSTLLDLARIQAGLVTPEPTTFSLQDLIERVVAQHPGAPIKVDIRDEPIWLVSDPNLLERLLRNLVSNALKHGGGEAAIEVQSDARAATIAVSDKGPGIAENDRKRIFEEFVRLDGRASSEGLGLGLAIVKRLAGLLGAQIEVRSALGQGSSFIVRLQAISNAPGEPQANIAQDLRLDGAEILVMDDDQLALEAMARSVRDLGGFARTCSSEIEMNAVLESGFKPQVAVLDLRIDGAFAGVEIGKRLRQRLAIPPAIVVVTGDTGPEALELLRASGFAWLIKPVSQVDFARTIVSATQRRQENAPPARADVSL